MFTDEEKKRFLEKWDAMRKQQTQNEIEEMELGYSQQTRFDTFMSDVMKRDLKWEITLGEELELKKICQEFLKTERRHEVTLEEQLESNERVETYIRQIFYPQHQLKNTLGILEEEVATLDRQTKEENDPELKAALLDEVEQARAALEGQRQYLINSSEVSNCPEIRIGIYAIKIKQTLELDLSLYRRENLGIIPTLSQKLKEMADNREKGDYKKGMYYFKGD